MRFEEFRNISSSNVPSVSVAIPTYNESDCIETVIRQFLDTHYPNLIEIYVADGGSVDGTQDTVKKISLEDSRVKLIHNPLKIQSAGLNQILQVCSGDIFLRADAHSEYRTDYIERCVKALLDSEALNVGGAQRFAAKTAFQAGIALASKSLLGSGGAKYRNYQYSGYAETVYLGCFWRKVLLDLEGYRIDATANEDAELNLRLKQYACKRADRSADRAIYISSEIQSWYYPRKAYNSLLAQYFNYGRGRCLTSIRHPNQFHVRGMLPFFALSLMVLLVFVDLLFPNLNLAIENLVLLGLILVLLESLRITLKFFNDFRGEIWRGKPEEAPPFLARFYFCGVALITIPIAHSCGFAYQLFRNTVLRISNW